MKSNIENQYDEVDASRLLEQVRRKSRARLALNTEPYQRLAIFVPIAFGIAALGWLVPVDTPAAVRFMLIIGSCGAVAALIEIWYMRRRLEAIIELLKYSKDA